MSRTKLQAKYREAKVMPVDDKTSITKKANDLRDWERGNGRRILRLVISAHYPGISYE